MRIAAALPSLETGSPHRRSIDAMLEGLLAAGAEIEGFTEHDRLDQGDGFPVYHYLRMPERQRAAGRGIHTLLRLHPELAGSPLLAPPGPPRWFPLAKRLVPPLLRLISAADQRQLPFPKGLLHRVLLVAYYLGKEETEGSENLRQEPEA